MNTFSQALESIAEIHKLIQGMPFIDPKASFYEFWKGHEQTWAMTEEEIKEQADRLK